MEANENSLLKNYLNQDFVNRLAKSLGQHSPEFSRAVFLNTLKKNRFQQLELKQRIRLVSQAMHAALPLPYKKQIAVLKKTAPDFTGLAGLVFPDFVEIHGLEDFDTSLEALKYFTCFSTSEFAIRPYILKYPERTLQTLQLWSRDANEHVRRLSSEGIRPRLPWSFKLKNFVHDPRPVIALLQNLKEDESLYVRKSVANNLNDISKDHPETVLRLASEWVGKNEKTDWILKHALRTLLKKGHLQALQLFGFKPNKNIQIQNLRTTQKIYKIGSHLEFAVELHHADKKSVLLRIEYAIHYVKKSGVASKKIFQLTERIFSAGTHTLKKKHSLKQMTTRKHYPGIHKVEIIVNGVALKELEFQLK